MNAKVRSVLIQLVLLSVGVLMLFLAFRGQNLEKLMADMRSANYRFVGFSLLILLLSHFVRGLRWKMLIEPLGFKPTNANVFSAVLIGYLANLAVPRLGEVTRCGIINRTDGTPVDQLIGTVLMERLSDVLMLLVCMLLTLLTQYEVLKTFFLNQVWKGLSLKGHHADSRLFIAALVFMGVLALGIFLVWKKKEMLLSLAPLRKLGTFLSGILSGFKTIAKMKGSGLFVFYSIVIWALYAISTGLVFRAISPTAGLPFTASLFVLTAASLGMVAPVQGGIGAYHFMVTQALILLGIAPESGLCYATINHSSQLVLILFSGGIAVGYVLWFCATAKSGILKAQHDLERQQAIERRNKTNPQ